MADFDPWWESPLGAADGEPIPRLRQQDLEVVEQPFRRHIVVRAGDAERASAAIAETCGVALPTRPNSAARADGHDLAALWRGPNEWLLIGDDDAGWSIESLAEALSSRRAAAVDVSSGQTVLDVSGSHSRALLARVCTLDLHPHRFEIDHCAGTQLAKTSGVLWRADEDRYVIVVRRSFADYLWRWLRTTSSLLISAD